MPYKILLIILFNSLLFSNTIEIEKDKISSVLPYTQYTLVKNINEKPIDLKNNSWKKNKKDIILNPDNLAFWMKFKVKKSKNTLNKLYLMFDREFNFKIEYYLQQDNRILKNINVGYYKRQEKADFIRPHHIFSLPLTNNREYTIFIKVQSLNNKILQCSILSDSDINHFYNTYNMVQSMFLGAVIIILLSNFALFMITKFKPYIYYIFYNISATIYFASFLGYIKAYSSIPMGYINMLLVFSVVGAFIFIGRLVQQLFNYKIKFPRINKLIFYIQLYLLVNLLIYMFFIYHANFIYVHLCFVFFPILLPIYYLIFLGSLLYLTYKEKNLMALFYVINWTFFGFIALIQVAIDQNFFSLESQPIFILELGLIIESVLLSLFLALRMKEIEKLKNQKQTLLIQQNKLASMGEMISAIAHQWRQPLSEINGVVLDLDIDYRKEILDAQRMENHLNEIEKITDYLSQTINDFLEFSNSHKILSTFFLSDIVKKCEEIGNLKIDYDSNDDIQIHGHKSELLQALLIITKNSTDACKEKNIIPKITIHSYIKKELIYISIKDNGGGIEKNIINEIFNPYFTTKHPSKGTGLGLYILKMIIQENMQGTVNLSNHKHGVNSLIVIPKKLE